MRRLRNGALLVLLIVVMALPAGPAAGQGGDAGARPRRVTEGTLLWRTAGQQTPGPAPVLDTDVEMRVTGMVLRATVRHEFLNPSSEWAEGLYVFPLPDDAAVDHLRMRVGERLIEGVIQERAAAKTTYEHAKQEGKRASLVEQERPNIFTTSIANIPPGAAIVVEIEYQQAVRYDAGQFRLRFPMVVGPRYIPGVPAPTDGGPGWAADTDAVPDASRITPPVQRPHRGPINPVSLRIELDAGVPLAGLESPYHRIHTTPLSAGRYEITLDQFSVPADRDFELVWRGRRRRPSCSQSPRATRCTRC
jgi:Ca-activated chloride channel family protein